MGEQHELDILHPCQQVLLPVVDANPDLYGTQLLAGEQGHDIAQSVGVQSAVRVHDAHDHFGLRQPGDQLTRHEVADGRVQSLTLALTSFR